MPIMPLDIVGGRQPMEKRWYSFSGHVVDGLTSRGFERVTLLQFRWVKCAQEVLQREVMGFIG